MEDIKTSYTQIEDANKGIQTMKIGSKDYAPVNERVKAFRKVYPSGSILTEIEDKTDDNITILAIVKDGEKIIATGRATEKKAEKGINASHFLENCETSAIGRALGVAGFGVDTAVASAEDMEKVDFKSSYVISTSQKISIPMKDALDQARLTINELYKKMGIRKEDLNDFLTEKIWTTLNDMNINQLMKLELELKKANMEDSEWHCLYNQNTKAKDVVPINQEVSYKTTWTRFGEIALKMCGTDELKRQGVIEEYMEMNIDLGTSYDE